MLRSKKALSPVVASIILIAVTVAVSIAVAAWMGALTFTFTATEQITYTSFAWATPGNTTVGSCAFTIKNTGGTDLSIAQVQVDSKAVTPASKVYNPTGPLWPSLPKGNSVTINITQTFQRGTTYNFMVVTSKGNQFGPYVQTTP